MKYLETICIQEGVIQHLEYHRKRMEATSGCLLTAITVPDVYCKGRVKCRIVYNKVIEEITFSCYQVADIRTLRIVEGGSIDYHLKYEDRTPLAALYEQRVMCDDILIVCEGNVTDTSYCNIVFQREGKFYTSNTPLLHGTKRARLIDEGKIIEMPIKKSDISSFECIRLINSMIDLEDEVVIPISLVQGI